jgi:Na+/H+ antiporter NhaD/arsenite permease-like protein
MELTLQAWLAIAIVGIAYAFLISEKIDKVFVTMIGAATLVLFQVFGLKGAISPQEQAFHYLSKNLDVFGFIIGMMLLVGTIRETGMFEALAVWIVKKLKGDPKKLFVAIGYLTLIMTAFISNIPTILILTPVLLVLIRTLKLPAFPFFFHMVAMANIGGATSPLSDATTYYEANTVGLGFLEVVSNSGFIVLILSVVTTIYGRCVFAKELMAVEVSPEDIADFNPRSAIKSVKKLCFGLAVLLGVVLAMSLKEQITQLTGMTIDNASIVIAAAFVSMFLFKVEPRHAFREHIEWETVFFFVGLFILIGSLEFTGVIDFIGRWLGQATGGNAGLLLFVLTVGSAVLSVFIDNVPYNITMIGVVQSLAAAGIHVYPLWWGLNVGTSIGGAGSMIGAACNVIALDQAAKESHKVGFAKYLRYGLPLVIINSLTAFGVLAVRYLM